MDFVDSCEKLNRAVEEIFESQRRGEDYLIQRKWFLAAFKHLFDIADQSGVVVDGDVASMLKQRFEKIITEHKNEGISLEKVLDRYGQISSEFSEVINKIYS